MTAIWGFPELGARLADDILSAPADPSWRRAYAHELSYGRHAGPARTASRLAAVAIVLCWDGGEWSLPLTVRGAELSRHSGQVSLPGGLVDANEDSRDAARRELAEELGQSPELVWLGDLAPLYVYASDTLVTPCVAAVDGWPAWKAQPPEVELVLRPTLRELLEASPAPPLEIERGAIKFTAPQLVVEGHSVWGATAVVLSELRGRIHRINAERAT